MFLNHWFNYVDGVELLVQITVIRLVGYREWTESLGPDREHVIQSVQARMHSRLVELFSRVDAWAHPFRYDYLLAITNGIGANELAGIVRELGRDLPVPLSSGTYAHEKPSIAEREAFKLALRARPWENLVGNTGNDLVGIAHIDLVNSTANTEETSSYLLYEHVWSVVNQVRLYLAPYGAVTLYLGGDNIVSIIQPVIDEEELRPIARLLNARIGVGIAKRGRTAMKLATEALDELRIRNKQHGALIISEDGL